VTPEEAHAICEENGWLERIYAEVAAAPPVSDELAAELRRLLSPRAQPKEA
jgi:hypothetical protein